MLTCGFFNQYCIYNNILYNNIYNILYKLYTKMAVYFLVYGIVIVMKMLCMGVSLPRRVASWAVINTDLTFDSKMN